MKTNSVKPVLRIVFGVLLLLLSAGILFFNLFLLKTGYEHGLGFLNLLLFFGGAMLTIKGVGTLPPKGK